jgi:glucokinase
MIQSPNLPYLENINLKDIISKKFDKFVCIDNDVNVSAYAEYKLNPQIVNNNYKNIIFLAAGTGLGGGIILDGEIWRGSSGFAGELGHICIDINGDNCNCGGKGCLETYASSTGLIRRLKKHIWRFPNSSLSRISIDKINPEDIFEAAKNNDAVAMYVINEFTEALAAGIGSFINIFNPQAVVLGGGILVPNPQIIESAAKKARNYSFKKPYEECIIVPSYLKNDAGVIGAALYAKNLIEKNATC